MRNDELYLRDIVEACNAIEIFIAGLPKEIVVNNDLILSAVIRKFEVIGEACSKLSPQLRNDHPEIDWKAIIGFRNILIHQYFSSNLDIIWEAADKRLGPFKEQIATIVRIRNSDSS